MQNIALQVTLNGIPQAVTNLRELEAAILEAKSVLATTTTIGSDEFKKLSTEISQAESKLKNFKNAAKGKDVAGNLADIGKLGGAIAGSFATATAAVSLFGTESESITKAATTAQNALTIALGAKSAAEGLGVVKTIAANIAQRALTASTVATTTATRTFYTVLAANPYGAILAAVGLLIAGLVLLTKAESDNEKQAKAANKANKDYLESIKTAGVGAKLTANQVGFLFEEFKAGRLTLEQIEPFVRKFASALQNVNLETLEGQTIIRQYITNLADLAVVNDKLAAKQQEYTEAVKNADLERQRAIRKEIEQLTVQAAQYTAFIVKAEEEDKKRGEERQKRLEAAAKAQENLKKLLLEELQLQGELRKIELQRTTKGIDIEMPEINTNLEKRNELLKSLKKNQSDYNNVFEEYQDIIKETKSFSDFKFIGEGLEEQSNAIFLNQQLIRNSLELAGQQADIQQENLNNLLTTQSEFLSGQRGNTEEYIQNQKDLIEFEKDFVQSFVDTNIKGFKGSTEELAAQRKILSDQAQVVFENLIENGNRIVEVNQYYKEAAERTAELRKENEGLAKSTEVLNGFLEKNGELLSKSIQLPIKFANAQADALILEEQIASRKFDQAKIFASDIEQLEYTLLQNGIDIRNASYEEKLKLLLRYLKLEIEATEEADKKKQDSNQKTIDNILKTIGQLQAALGAIQATTTDLFNFQFDQLEKRYKRTQESLVEDTAENNAKRIEAEKIYIAEKARLEKQAAKASLRIQLAQTIANAAQAITVALTAGPVVGQILAGVVAAASLVQIGIVTAQLNAVDSYRKGGILKSYATGGYVRGPSHENGGVKFQGGGIELEGRESVINRVSTVRYQDLLNQINLAGGGSPIMANLDDSRIVEAIATQRREPIRAYVVQSEITSSQNIQKRLELLSQI